MKIITHVYPGKVSQNQLLINEIFTFGVGLSDAYCFKWFEMVQLGLFEVIQALMSFWSRYSRITHRSICLAKVNVTTEY